MLRILLFLSGCCLKTEVFKQLYYRMRRVCLPYPEPGNDPAVHKQIAKTHIDIYGQGRALFLPGFLSK
jgi:hypothetical protein